MYLELVATHTSVKTSQHRAPPILIRCFIWNTGLTFSLLNLHLRFSPLPRQWLSSPRSNIFQTAVLWSDEHYRAKKKTSFIRNLNSDRQREPCSPWSRGGDSSQLAGFQFQVSFTPRAIALSLNMNFWGRNNHVTFTEPQTCLCTLKALGHATALVRVNSSQRTSIAGICFTHLVCPKCIPIRDRVILLWIWQRRCHSWRRPWPHRCPVAT